MLPAVPPQTLCTVPGTAANPAMASAGSGDWNRDGVIIFGSSGTDSGGPLWKVSQAGGAATAVTAVDGTKGDLYHWAPAFLPDGKHYIYLRSGGPEVRGIYSGSLDAKPEDQSRERLLATSSPASYANGYLFFNLQGALMAQPFDAERLRLNGEPVPLAEGVDIAWFSLELSRSRPAVSSPIAAELGGSRQFTWFDRKGKDPEHFRTAGYRQHGSLIARRNARPGPRRCSRRAGRSLDARPFERAAHAFDVSPQCYLGRRLVSGREPHRFLGRRRYGHHL